MSVYSEVIKNAKERRCFLIKNAGVHVIEKLDKILISGLVIIILFTIGHAIYDFVKDEDKKAHLEIKPTCFEIEINDEFYYEHGHADWVIECRK